MSMRGPDARDVARERAAVRSGRNRVDAQVAERRELVALASCDEAPEPAPRDVLEEHALDGVVGAEAKDLIPLRLDQAFGHAQEL